MPGHLRTLACELIVFGRGGWPEVEGCACQSAHLRDAIFSGPGKPPLEPRRYAYARPELGLVSGPSIQSEMPRDLRRALHAFHQRSDQSVNIRLFSGARPILDALSVAAELEVETALSSMMGPHHLREAQTLRLD